MRNTFNISFGFWILILPFLGIPIFWKTLLICSSGLLLILVGIGPSLLIALKEKPKTQKKKIAATTQSPVDSSTVPPQNTEKPKDDIEEPLV